MRQYTAREVDRRLERLPQLLAAARTARGLSYRAAGAQIGCNGSQVHQVEHGRNSPRLPLARKILLWLDDGS